MRPERVVCAVQMEPHDVLLRDVVVKHLWPMGVLSGCILGIVVDDFVVWVCMHLWPLDDPWACA